jgi:hypothetical protein|tara:strand:+ start:5509 stop:5724 length:216 start_codon:yes stop_codon:yes gene_type:complete
MIKKIIYINIINLFILTNYSLAAKKIDCTKLELLEKKTCQSKNILNKTGSKMPNFIKKGFKSMKDSNKALK